MALACLQDADAIGLGVQDGGPSGVHAVVDHHRDAAAQAGRAPCRLAYSNAGRTLHRTEGGAKRRVQFQRQPKCGVQLQRQAKHWVLFLRQANAPKQPAAAPLPRLLPTGAAA